VTVFAQDWASLAAGALGLVLTAVGWTAVEARAGRAGRRAVSAVLIVVPSAIGLAVPDLAPIVIAGVVGGNLLFAFFAAWGLQAGADTAPYGALLPNLGCLGIGLAWLAAAAGAKLIIDGAAPPWAPLLLLSALPILAGVVTVGDVQARRANGESLWVLALLILPLLLAFRLYLVDHRG